MAVVGTAAMAINIALAVLTARTTQQIVHEQVAQLLNELRYQETLAEALVITSLTNNFLTDSLFVEFPYFAVDARGFIRHTSCTVATGFLSVVSVSFQDATITYGLAAATNVVLTALTAGRILWMRRDASHIPVDKTLRPRYNMAIRLTLESGVIYCIAAIVLLITSLGAAKIGSAAETSSVIGGGFFQSLLNIIPTFTLVYVGRIAADTPEDRNFSASSTRIPRRMHSGLGLLEIVEMVVEQVGLYDPLPLGGNRKIFFSPRHNLAVLARTSKVFRNPALNVLWREQHTVFNLLKCMPADLWNISEYPNEEGWPDDNLSIILKRTILPTDWERPLFYLHRVESFTLDDNCFLESLDFFEALSLCLPTQHIFPNLVKLYWVPEPGTAFHHVRLFLAPQIKDLVLGSIRSVSHLCIFPDLAVLCSFLTNLTIFTPLAELSIPSMFAFSPAWTTRPCGHAAGPEKLEASSQAGTPIFPSLTRVMTPTMEDFITLISSLIKCSLVYVGICTIRSRTTATIARQFYSTVARNCSPSYLREIIVRGEETVSETLSSDQYDIYTVAGDTLRPLLSFHNLVNVSLTHPSAFDLDDSVIRDMASAWPRIQILRLTASSYHHVRSRVTLQALYAFAEHCPVLRCLDISFDATAVPQLTSVRQTQRALQVIDVVLSPITKPRPVAKFLAAMFRGLQTINTLFGKESRKRFDCSLIHLACLVLFKRTVWLCLAKHSEAALLIDTPL
ncbi:hypothetical protein B0H19DRAFT_1373939 [Mycena capillaripes]|nr:hypothetical protein B0H19DRAFT_1373939 [Mycena capillaripes]